MQYAHNILSIYRLEGTTKEIWGFKASLFVEIEFRQWRPQCTRKSTLQIGKLDCILLKLEPILSMSTEISCQELFIHFIKHCFEIPKFLKRPL